MTTVRPELADVYFDWEAESTTDLPISQGKTVAVAATADSGPVNVVEELTSYGAYIKLFGPSDTALRRAVFGAFKGQGVNGMGGAGKVLAYRQATPSAATATHTLQNSTPAGALALSAKYPGTRGNNVRVTVQAGTVGGTTEILILDGSLVVEKYDFTSTNLASVAADINALSDYVTAAVLVDGTALATVSSVALTGGNDGAVLTGTEWTNTFAAFDRERWGIFPAYGLTDPTIRASIVAWIQQRNALGDRCMAVFGGASGEALSTATTRSQAINDFDIINLGEGTLHLTDDNRDCSTAEFVTRYAGARAWRGEARDDFFVRFGDVELVSGATLAEQATALDTGVVVFSRDTNAAAPVFIREAVNTYTDDTQSPRDEQGHKTHPVALYRRIKNIAIQQGIEQEVRDWARTGNVLGDQPNDEKSRALILGRVQIAYSTRETARVVQHGWTVAQSGTPSDDDDFVEYVHGFHPTRSLRQILNTARIG